MAKIDLNYDAALIDLLSRGNKNLLESNKWEKNSFENRISRAFFINMTKKSRN
jgi:hypothetical protein